MAERRRTAVDVETVQMSQITDRLVADMRWRLSPAGRRHQPGRRERESWGSGAIPAAGPIMGGCAVQAITLGLAISAFDKDFIVGGLLLLFLFCAALPGAFMLRGRVQTKADLAAYRKLLETNERFALVEYSRLLGRQIQAARADPSLGGPAEVARLTELLGKINQLIQEGAGHEKHGSQSLIASEAVLAESIVEVYSVGKDDGLAGLDARLPDELRARLDSTETPAPRDRGKSAE